MEEYLFVELNKQHEKAGEESVSNVSWVLWAYMNNQEEPTGKQVPFFINARQQVPGADQP